jgi:hypothetical protein
MKLSLDALRTGQRLQIRVPASPPSFVKCFTTCLFRNLGCISGKFVGNLLLIKEGLPSSVQNSETLRFIPPEVFADCVGDLQLVTLAAIPIDIL